MPNSYTFSVVDANDLVSSSIEAEITKCAEYVISLVSRYLDWKGTLDFIVEIRPASELTWSDADGLLPSYTQIAWNGFGWTNLTLVECLTGVDGNPARADAGCTIYLADDGTIKNHGSPVWFDPDPRFEVDPGVPSGKHDFVGILTHEIFHSLGIDERTVQWRNLIFDDGERAHFVGENAMSLYGGRVPFVRGTDHYGFVADPGVGISRGLMFQFGNYEANRLDIGRIDLGILADLGHSIKSYDGLALFELIDTAVNLAGGDADDRIFGDYHSNVLTGGAGNDLIEAGAGGDNVDGGTGNDWLSGGRGGDLLTGGDGDDRLFSSGAVAIEIPAGTVLDADGDRDILAGGNGDDILYAGWGDEIDGGPNGSAGDRLHVSFVGAPAGVTADFRLLAIQSSITIGATTITGVEAVPFIEGSEHADFIASRDDSLAAGGVVIDGRGGNDRILGSPGGDRIDGGDGADEMSGAAGGDLYFVDSAGDSVLEGPGEGADEVHTSLAAYTLADNVENLIGTSEAGQVLAGNILANVITGGSGGDTITGDVGDTLIGGLGNDIYVMLHSASAVENAGEGVDEIRTGLSQWLLADHFENLTGTSSAFQALRGNAADNVLRAGPGGADLFGEGGADTLIGSGASDGLFGGDGADQMIGAGGSDAYHVDAGDVVIEWAGEGLDSLSTALASYLLPDHVETLFGTASAAQQLTGNAQSNRIVGTDFNDILDGGAGDDALEGGFGDDLYFVDTLGDTIADASGDGDEVRTSLTAYTLAANIERLTGTSISGQALTGNALANVVVADTGDDILDGGSGIDILRGGIGDDIYFVDWQEEAVELAGEGADELRTATANHSLEANIENLTGLSNGGQMLVGNGLANVIAAGAGNDVLDGSAGVDVMRGGAGDDTYHVDDAGDTVTELSGGGIDRVISTISLLLSAEVDNLTLAGAGAIDGTGNALSNLIVGNDAANRLDGGAGDDRLEGGGGDDRLEGGLGVDMLVGGLGNDLYVITGDGDAIDELAAQGTDGILTALASYSLAGTQIENLTGIGIGDQTLTGNAFDNVIDGGAGNDIMAGAIGNDTYTVDSLGDVVNELGGEGTDTVRTAIGDMTAPAYALYYIPANVENLAATSNAGQGVGGNTLNNVVTAGSGADLIAMHQGGVDSVDAGAGADYIWFGNTLTGADVVNGGLGRDTLAILGTYASLSLGANVTGIERLELFSSGGPFTYTITLADSVNSPHPNFFEVVALSLTSAEHLNFDGSSDTDSRYFIRGGAGNDVLSTGAGNDRIVGNDGNDTLFGNAGNDTLAGGNGQDRYDTGTGSDTIEVLSASQSTSTGHDIITGFDPSVDRINVSGTFAGWGASQAGGLNAANFDAMLAAAVDGALGPNQAVKFTATAGDHDGKTFVVYDANGDGSYTAGADYVFQFVNPAPLEGNAFFF